MEAVKINDTDRSMLYDSGAENWDPFENYWYKALMVTLYSIVCVGCIVGKYY